MNGKSLVQDKQIIVLLFLVMVFVSVSADHYGMNRSLNFAIDASKQLLTALFVVTVQRYQSQRANDPKGGTDETKNGNTITAPPTPASGSLPAAGTDRP